MGRERLYYLFTRYVNNRCTDSEKSEFLQLVSDGHNDEEVSELMNSLWSESPSTLLTHDRSDAILAQILRETEGRPKRKQVYFRFAGQVAASLLIVLAFSASALFYFAGQRSAEPNLPKANAVAIQPGFIKLPDGSTVILNGSSKLHFPSVFADSVREVTLMGEGFFDIAHDPERPFIVHTGNLRTTVLGTAFNIRAYPDQSDVTVTVTRGKVRVSDDRQVFGIVNPDEQITVYKGEAVAQQKGIDSHQATSWIEKDIYFDDVTVAEAIDQLEKRFGARIMLEGSGAGSCRFTATFIKGEDLSQILRIICDFNNADLETDGEQKFLIRGGKCPL